MVRLYYDILEMSIQKDSSQLICIDQSYGLHYQRKMGNIILKQIPMIIVILKYVHLLFKCLLYITRPLPPSVSNHHHYLLLLSTSKLIILLYHQKKSIIININKDNILIHCLRSLPIDHHHSHIINHACIEALLRWNKCAMTVSNPYFQHLYILFPQSFCWKHDV